MEEKKNNHELRLVPSARREKSVTLSEHSLLLWANASVSSSETPTKPQRNADLSSRIGQPGICRSTGLSSRLSGFCWLVSSLPDSHLLTDSFSWQQPSLDCDLLLTALSCRLVSGTFLSSSSPVSWEISRSIPLCGFCAKTDKGIFWLALTYTHRNKCHPSCHKL